MNLITVFNGMGIENENGIFSKFILVYPVIYNYSRMSRRSDGARQRAIHTQHIHTTWFLTNWQNRIQLRQQ